MGSVYEEITRLETAKADIETAIEGCGVNVPDTDLISTYALYIRQIPSAVFSELNVDPVGGEDKYIKSIKQTNGLIEATTGGLVSSTSSGIVPKITVSSTAINSQANDWILTSTSGKTPAWKKLPTSAFYKYVGTTELQTTSKPQDLTGIKNIIGENSKEIIHATDGYLEFGKGFSDVITWFNASLYKFKLGNTQAFIITTDGKVGIGDVGGAPKAKLHVAGGSVLADSYHAWSGGFSKEGCSNAQILLAGGGHRAVSDFATSSGVVTALGTSGNLITWTKNGIVNTLTVPYATIADSANSVAWSNVTGKPSTFTPSSHNHSQVLDISSSSATTFAYSKAGLNYGDYTWLAGWNGYELRAVNKNQFALASHTHDDRYFTESEINTKLGSYLLRRRMTNPSDGTSWQGAIPFNIGLKGAGYPVYTDPEFAFGKNSVNVYNNSGNGTVTISRIADNQGSANSSGYILQISTTSGTASPGRGGFYQDIISRLNAVFAQVFRAKIPTGFSVVNAENNMGNGYSTHWLTDTAGTGKWEWYVRITICGNGGPYSGGGHVYLSGSGAVTWYLSYCNVIDLTKGNYDGLRTRYSDYATSAGNADTVDSYHVSSLWRSDGATWNPMANITMTPTSNGQEWSFDFRSKGSYTGSYWHVWDESKNTLLKVDADSGAVSAPYGFVGNLTGNASSASTVTVNNSDANSTYRMVWHSGNTLYGTGGIYCNPYTDYLYAASVQTSDWFRSSGNTGWYNPTNSCQVYPNNLSTYGGLILRGTKGGYHGFLLGESSAYMNLMDNGNSKGLYQESNDQWIVYYHRTNKKLGLLTSSLKSYPITLSGDTYIVGGWIRTEGNTGWYNESYGGGWYMSDFTWLRAYNDKGVVAGGFYHNSYGSSAYALTSDGGAAHIGSMSVNYANSAGISDYLKIHDIRNNNYAPNSTSWPLNNIRAWFNNTGTPNGDWWSGITVKGWTNDYNVWLLASTSTNHSYTDFGLFFRTGNGSSWTNWKNVVTSESVNNIVVTTSLPATKVNNTIYILV